jgi:16S rRNA pseudouridine516 synthase
MSGSRLDRHLAHALQISRSDAQRLVRRGRVTIDQAVVRDPSRHVPPGGEVRLDEALVTLPGQVVLMLHKPAGVVTATRDAAHETVLDVVPPALRVRDLSPVGRLDKDATGLLLLTNDGALLHRLTHPKRHVPRSYALTWQGELPEDARARVAAGLELADGTRCLPAELIIERAGAGEMTVYQGMYHQVKRMIAALGGVVTSLHRTRYGPLQLGELAAGQTRALSPEEVTALLQIPPESPNAL